MAESSPQKKVSFSRWGRQQHVKGVLLRGVFWRIFIIEAILLVGSLAYRAWTQGGDFEDLFWYAVRIMLLVGVIIAFMMLTLQKFLNRRIILPLETLAQANRHLQNDDPRGRHVDLPDDAPREFQEIVATRHRMLSTILKVSEERLHLVKFIRETFGRYLSQEVVEEILSSPEGQKIGGHRQQVTVLLSDLRGFTSMSQSRDPEEIVKFLNRYLELMSEVILSFGGMIDEFIGDAVLAVFGVPETAPDDTARAAACAIAMQNALRDLNQQITQEGHPHLEMGIAVETGIVVVGNMGSEKRLKYGIVGPVVNQASRIESTTVGGQVLMGSDAHALLGPLVSTGKKQSAVMKGLEQPLEAYPVLAMGPPYDLELDGAHQKEDLTPLELGFEYWLLDGKKVAEVSMTGRTSSLSPSTIMARLDSAPPLLSNLKFRLELPAEAGPSGDIYAKVVSVDSEPKAGGVELRITAINSKDRENLARLRDGAG